MWRRCSRQWHFSVLATLRSSRSPIDVLIHRKQPLLSRVYGWIIDCKRKRELKHVQRIAPPHIPVLSVGNVTFGATGKTPLVQYLIDYVLKVARDGQVPLLLSRGYGDDEWRMLAKQFPACQLAVGADRVRIGAAKVKEVLERQAASLSCVIVDDGLQQWRLAKDVEIVMVDALHPLGNGLLLPCGSLRELPREALKRADIVIVHHANLLDGDSLEKLMRNLLAMVESQRNCIVATSQMKVVGLLPAEEMLSRGSKSLKSDSLMPKAQLSLINCLALVICGVGNPESVTKVVEKAACWARVETRPFPDHYAFTSRDVESIGRWADELQRQWCKKVVVVTTEKDFARSPCAMKLLAGTVDLRVLRCELELLHKIDQVKKRLDLLLKNV